MSKGRSKDTTRLTHSENNMDKVIGDHSHQLTDNLLDTFVFCKFEVKVTVIVGTFFMAGQTSKQMSIAKMPNWVTFSCFVIHFVIINKTTFSKNYPYREKK